MGIGNRVAYEINRGVDPFAQVLHKILSMQYSRGMIDGSGKHGQRAAMFPDILNGNYVPDGGGSTIRLKTGPKPNEHIPLEDIGAEFRHFERFSQYKGWS